jgi:putative ABC transport system ATP-binding protein
MSDKNMKILEGLNQNGKTTVVIVTHDEEKARRTQRILRIFDGQLIH